MKIGINALFLVPNEVGGTEYFLRSFLSNLEKQDLENQYVVFCNSENYSTFNFSNPRWEKIECKVKARNRLMRILYEQLLLPFKTKKMNCDILHSYGYFGPIFSDTKQILTVHDANWKDHPEDSNIFVRFTLSLLINLSIIRSKVILTDSYFSKCRLLVYFPQIKERLKVIKPGVDNLFLNLLQNKSSRPLPHKYILCVSAFYPHKRVPYILEIWKEITKRNENMRLVLIGKNGADQEKVLLKIKELKNIVYYPKVTLKELVTYYKYAEAFVFPSIYEGFGFPVYEALCAGVPVFVGRKDLYDKSIQKFLHELTKPTSDLKAILKSRKIVGQETAVRNNFNYENSTKELIKLYRNNNLEI